jgi:hypothetical protein
MVKVRRQSPWLDLRCHILKKPDIRIQFLSQAADDCFGRHHLAINHGQQLSGINSKPLTQLEDVGVGSNASGADVLREFINNWLSHLLV